MPRFRPKLSGRSSCGGFQRTGGRLSSPPGAPAGKAGRQAGGGARAQKRVVQASNTMEPFAPPSPDAAKYVPASWKASRSTAGAFAAVRGARGM